MNSALSMRLAGKFEFAPNNHADRPFNKHPRYGSAFFLPLAAFQSTWGKAYKYFPLKAIFVLSIIIFEIGSLICGVAQNSKTLIVGRAVSGAGGSGIASGAYTII